MSDPLRGVRVAPAVRDLPAPLPVCQRCGGRCTDRMRDGRAVCVPCESGVPVDRAAGLRRVLVVEGEW